MAGEHKPVNIKYPYCPPPTLAECVGAGTSAQIDMVQATAPHIGPWRAFGPAPNPVTHPESGKGES